MSLKVASDDAAELFKFAFEEVRPAGLTPEMIERAMTEPPTHRTYEYGGWNLAPPPRRLVGSDMAIRIYGVEKPA